MFYIDLTEDLIDICKEIKEKANIIAVDTEFTKQKEYFPDLSIIQISFFNGEIIKDCIIDVLADGIKLDSFFEILNDKNIKKVFHSCSQDVEALYFVSGKIPTAIEDTQIMAEFCAMKANLSYADLVKETLGIVFKKDKKLQMSDWKKRPLSQKQLEYASSDVEYLLEVYFMLAQKLNRNKNFKYYRMEIDERYGSDMIENLVKDSWKKIRFRLGNRSNNYMQMIKEFCRLRERISIERNLVKGMVMADCTIKSILVSEPKDVDELKNILESDSDFKNNSDEIRQKFYDLFNIITEKTKKSNIEDKTYILELKNKTMLQKFEEINDYIIAACKRMEINPDLIHNKMDINSYLGDSENLEDLFRGWKIEVFGSRIKEIKERN